ncbi:MAG: hypothetical protein ACRDYX_16325 [Egibacteraceae bacterium]
MECHQDGFDGSLASIERLLEGASDALVRRLATLAYADTELAVLLLGTLGPGSQRYLQRGGALDWQLDVDGRPRLTDRGWELCKLAAMRMADRDLNGRVKQARSALSEAVARAERMERRLRP